MNSWELNARASELLAREGNALDTKNWDAWLALFKPELKFWMPAWKSETEQTQDPDSEMSLLYFESRAHLEDRVWRLRGGKSIASAPLFRTAHATSHVLCSVLDAQQVAIEASWACHVFNPKRQLQNVFFGRYEYVVDVQSQDWLISQKKIILQNDYIPTLLDIYCI